MRDGAGSLLLLAAVAATGLHTAFPAALPRGLAGRPWLARLLTRTLLALLLTLLFLGAVGLRRLCDLRTYTGDTLALLTQRGRAYAYRTADRFLTALATAGAADPLTTALARYTAAVWIADPTTPQVVYIDGHRKPVHTASVIPRGLVGRTGKILGCRALTLLHDGAGHVLLATTARGDQHLTVGAPAILATYEQANAGLRLTGVVVDREGMSAAWLAHLVRDGRTVVTLLRRDQYSGLESFSDIGAFTPLSVDAAGQIVREVAPARFLLPVPGQPDAPLPLSVALIRDHRWREPVPPDPDADPVRWLADLPWEQQRWWGADWQATPAPAAPTQAHLIPIVSTAATRDAVALAELYTRRWPCQENVIRDWLLPLGLDTNHGYTKTATMNSETSKQRTELEARRDRLAHWATRARERHEQAERRAKQREGEYRNQAAAWYRELNRQQDDLVAQAIADWQIKRTIRERKAAIDDAIRQLKERWWAAQSEQEGEWRKLERYCREQRQVLRQLEDLAARERQMYELDNAKDQIMTVCKVAAVTLGMYVRDHWFPTSYAGATWARLAPFLALRGRVRWGAQWVEVELCPFNDRQLNRDLANLCTRVAEHEARLPDGRRLIFAVRAARRPALDVFPP